jgi:hypothetical protein
MSRHRDGPPSPIEIKGNKDTQQASSLWRTKWSDREQTMPYPRLTPKRTNNSNALFFIIIPHSPAIYLRLYSCIVSIGIIVKYLWHAVTTSFHETAETPFGAILTNVSFSFYLYSRAMPNVITSADCCLIFNKCRGYEFFKRRMLKLTTYFIWGIFFCLFRQTEVYISWWAIDYSILSWELEWTLIPM